MSAVPVDYQSFALTSKTMISLSTRASRAIKFREPPLTHLQLFSVEDLEMKSFCDGSEQKQHTKRCTRFARNIYAHISAREVPQKMEPEDNNMLASMRELDNKIAIMCSEGKMANGDQEIRHMRIAVHARTHLFYYKVLVTYTSDYHAFCRKIPRMATLPHGWYPVVAQTLIYHLQKHWWKLFREANQRITAARLSRYGSACHPASLLVLLALARCVQLIPQVPHRPVQLERLLEMAVLEDPAFRSCRGRLPIGFDALAEELIECMLYAFVGEEIPTQPKDGHIPFAEGRRMLFADR